MDNAHRSDLIIFGTGEIAEVISFYFSQDTTRTVAGFVVDDKYATDSTFCGRPLVPLTAVQQVFPPDAYEAFVAVGYSEMNQLRADCCRRLEGLGYQLTSFVSSKSVVAPGTQVGKNCLILEHNTIQPYVSIGNNTFLWSGNHVGHHVRIGDHSFISSHCVMSGGVSVGEFSFLGVNSTIRDHVTLGDRVVVGAGALVMRDLPDGAVVLGQQSRIASLTSDQLPRF